MKMIIAIVHDDDGHKVMHGLNANGFTVTKLATTGGFLKAGNTTLLIGVEKEEVDNVIEIIEKISTSRTEVVTSPTPTAGITGVYMPFPIEVQVGGATIFVMDVERFEKV
ncbi:MAG: cyclic-di-AMP receptor [Hyphomonadaceae bacterium]|nr:cyclic-di-AMP receptor [Clostridia bacterium]